MVLGNLELDRERFDVRVAGRAVELSFIQFELLYQLALRADKVVDHQDLLKAIWGRADGASARKLRIHVSRLRKKIAGSRPWRIQTVTKRGYALVNAEADQPAPAVALAQAHSPVPIGGGGARGAVRT